MSTILRSPRGPLAFLGHPGYAFPRYVFDTVTITPRDRLLGFDHGILRFVQPPIRAFPGQQLGVTALLDDTPMVDIADFVRILDGG